MLRVGTLVFIILTSLLARAEDLVRVRLAKNQSGISVVGLGLNLQAEGQTPIIDTWPKSSRYRIEFKSGPSPHFNVRRGEKLTVLQGQRLKISGDMLRANFQMMPQSLELVGLSSGQMDLISILDVDKYLEVVLPSEMPASWPLEALKAQAVAARSYTLSQIASRNHLHYDLESTIQDQVFDLTKKQSATTAQLGRIRQALSETRGYKLLGSSFQVLKAHYHADCGGKTEEPIQVWAQSQNSGTAIDVACQNRKSNHWTRRVSRNLLNEKLRSFFRLPDQERLLTIQVASRSASDRAIRVLAGFTSGVKELSGEELRKILGYNVLRSAKFNLKWDSDAVEFEGNGYGHGVGLCQWGTRQPLE